MANSKNSKRKPVNTDENIGNDDLSESDNENSLEEGGDISELEVEDENEEDDGYEESEDDVEEILEDGKTEKRKREDDDDDEKTQRKRSKTKKKANVKPPTAEEMLALRETENLYISNLIRLQIDEMLAELKPKKSVKRYIGPWIENFKTFLTSLEVGELHALEDLKWLEEFKVKFPLRCSREVGDPKAVFQFQPPVDVFPIGSQSLGCPLGPFYSIDLAVVMPKRFLLQKDNFNQRYFFKRALYLCYIAGKIQSSVDLLSSEHKSQFTFLSGDPRKPILVLHPSGKLSKFIKIHVHTIPEDNSNQIKRLLPSKNNVRPAWWGIKKDILPPPTPLYNASVLEDVVLKINHDLKKATFEGNQNLKDAFVLLRVWLKQRELSEGFGAFNSHILSMLLVYLVKICKINKFMSSYQIIRHVWLYLGDSDWLENGPSLCTVKQEDAPATEEFHIYYDLVFVDATGYCNFASCLTKQTYLRVRDESKLAIQLIDNQNINCFSALFLTKMPFIRQYDIMISFYNYPTLEEIMKSKGDEISLMDRCNDVSAEFLKLVTELFEKGIGLRLRSIGVLVRPTASASWDIDSGIPTLGSLYIGLNLNPTTALSLIDKGPLPDDPGAEDFREFWGKKCDLRRFKDGTVCESVVWEENETSLESRKTITEKIIHYLLETKLSSSSPFYHLVTNRFQKLIQPRLSKPPCLSREETCKKILASYEDLSRQLVELRDLPLSVVSVHCISPAYRFTDPFPPSSFIYKENISPYREHRIKGRLFSADGKIGKNPPEYIPPIDCVVQMALSRKWPDDINACKRLIAAFNIAISAALKKVYNLSSQVTTDYFVVNKDGFLFRLYLGYSKEIALLKLRISETGFRMYRDTPESLAVEKKFINLPKLTGAIYRLSEEYPGFSSGVCLAKRWFGGQLLLDESHFPELLVELLLASLYLAPGPYSPPLGPLAGFLRLLVLLSTTDWSLTPLILNFNSLLTSKNLKGVFHAMLVPLPSPSPSPSRKQGTNNSSKRNEMKEMEDAFHNDRASFPPLFLATPYDRTGSLWTKTVPTVSTLLRLNKLAKASLLIVESNILYSSTAINVLKVFKPPMSVYDAVIKVRQRFQFRKTESMFYEEEPRYERRKELLTKENQPLPEKHVLPILGFNPVDLYISELREQYGSLALFFYDPYGGTEIGVSFKPDFLETVPFQISSVNGRKLVKENAQKLLKPHFDSVFEGFKIIGKGIVESIELVKLKDKISESSKKILIMSI